MNRIRYAWLTMAMAVVLIGAVAARWAWQERSIPELVTVNIQPILKLSLHVPVESRDYLFRNLEQFAKQNSFSFDLTWVQQDNDTMSARMRRKDGTLLVVSNGFEKEEFFLGLLPSLEGARSVADVRPPSDAPQLVSKIRSALASVPSLAISKDSADAAGAR